MDNIIIQNEAEFEYYGFTFEQFKIEINLFTKKMLKNCIDNFKNKLIQNLKNANSCEETIKKLTEYSFDQLCLRIFNELQPRFKEFYDLTDKTFSLSESIIYHFDENLDKYNETDEQLLENEIKKQEEEYLQNKYMLLLMEAELEMHKNMTPLFQKESQLIETLEKSLENFKEDFNQNEDLIETINNISGSFD